MKKTYRIGIDARMYRRSTGGIGRYTHGLINFLSEIDKSNLYYIFLTKEDLKEYDIKAKNFKPVESDYLHYSVREQFGFLKQLNSYKLDLVHFTNFNHPILYNRKYVITIHDLTMTLHPAPGKQSSSLMRYFYHLVLSNGSKKATKIIVDSDNTKKDLINLFKTAEDKISVVYLGVDRGYVHDKSREGRAILKRKYGLSGNYILFVSQWRPHKGIDKLVESFEILCKRYKMNDLKLAITGKPNEKFSEIETRIKNSSLKDRILTLGFVDEEDMVALYSNALVFVFPSIYEGFGLNPLEAMACGTPVATSNLSCIPEVCGDAALYFDPKDTEDIALKTHTIINNHVLRKKLIDRGFENVKRFSWEKMARQTKSIYLKAISENDEEKI